MASGDLSFPNLMVGEPQLEEDPTMYTSPGIRRVVLVVADGLRPDAIATFGLVKLQALMARGSYSLSARTVAPSVTAAAMTSLLTGVLPTEHGIRNDGFGIPKHVHQLSPLPRVLAHAGIASAAYLAQLPAGYSWLARQIARRAGVYETHFIGEGSTEILSAARSHLARSWSGLLFFHWPDTDRAGHEFRWMSPEYEKAAQRVDAAIGDLVDLIEIDSDPSTLLIVMADHGGGGAERNDHDSEHPLDTTIPVILAGGGVRPARLGNVHLLDVSATVLWAFGARVPATYRGRALVEAFHASETMPERPLVPAMTA